MLEEAILVHYYLFNCTYLSFVCVCMWAYVANRECVESLAVLSLRCAIAIAVSILLCA
jgi:hypothetical protein